MNGQRRWKWAKQGKQRKARVKRRSFSQYAEPLEARLMLTAINAIETHQGNLSVAGETQNIPLSINSDFTLASGSVLLGVEMTRPPGSGIDPAPVRIVNSLGSTVPANYVRNGTSDSLIVGTFTPGDYTLQVSADAGTAGEFAVEVFLVGDEDGNGVVNIADGLAIRAQFGARASSPSYTLAADANRDGAITSLDYAYWRRNLGDSTTRKPNTAPTITSAPVTTATEGQLYNYDVDATDSDVGDVLTYFLDAAPAGMTINANSGLIAWTPTNGQVGSNPVTVRVQDAGGLSDTQSFSINVANVNTPPTITSAPVTTATEGQLYNYDVDATDSDVGDVLTYFLDAAPAGMTINANSGLIAWTPTNGQVGTNPVTVRVQDAGGLSDTQSFSINVANVNTPPTITSAPVTTATEGQLYNYDVDATDSDVGDVLTYFLDLAPAGMTINANSGLIAWTPTNGQVGTNPVTVRVQDAGGLSDTQSFSINVANVNTPPTITSAPVTTATEGQLYNYDVDATDSDVGDVLSYFLDLAPAGMTINANSGLIAWTPTNGQVGSNPVTVRVQDAGGLSDTQSFSINVANVNTPPTITSAPVTTATEGQLYNYDVDATDSDLGDVLSYFLDLAPAGMTINANSGLIAWTPTNGQVGSNPVTVRVQDAGGLSDTQSFSINVANVNTPPTITSAPVTTATEGQLYNYDVDATDSDVGDVLTYFLDLAPAGMTINANSGLIAWTPTNGQVGSNPVTVRVQDAGGLSDTQSFSINVANVNTPPTITSAPVTTATEGQLYNYDVDATDSDVGDVLSYFLDLAPAGMTINANSGLIAWTPTNGQVGSNPVTVRVQDAGGLSDTQSFSINVANVNTPPTITSAPVTTATEGQLYNYDVDATDSDVGDVLTYFLDLAPAGMTINANSGLIAWTPTNGQVGSNPVTVRVQDAGGLSDTQSFSINVANVNTPPTITSAPVTTATEGQLYNYDVDATDSDVGDVLSYFLDLAPAGMTINANSGLIAWTPTNGQVGSNPVTVRVQDAGGLSDTQSFSINVANVNTPPTITSAPVTTATEGQLYNYDVDATDSDLGDVLSYFLDLAPAGMTINANSGLIAWTPTNGQVGSNPVTVRVQDAGGLSDTQSFSINVANVNTPPTITSAPVTTATEGQLYNYDVDATDSDLGDVLTYFLDLAPAGMTINANSGLIAWTPTNGQVGSNPVTVRVQDAGGLSDTQSFSINVTNVNAPPTITSAPVTTATEGQLYNYDVDATDSDLGDVLSYFLDLAPAGMTINANSGLIAWTPTNGQVGSNPVTVRVQDAGGLSDTQSFSINVAGVAPLADLLRPEVTLTVANPNEFVGNPINLTVTATDDMGVSFTQLTVNGSVVPLDGAGNGTFTSATPGLFEAVATAEDAAGNEGVATQNLRFLVTGDTTAPTVSITAPSANTTIRQFADIVGTASDDTQLIHYTLEYSVRGQNEFVLFDSGSTAVTGGVLGQFDGTMLTNGFYDIRLTAEDASGNVAATTRVVQVEGDAKVGLFTLAFQDLQIPVSGIPLTVVRAYDSRVKTSGDFGFGWDLSFSEFAVTKNVPVGEGWVQNSSGGFFKTYTVSPTQDHFITVTLPDGETETFGPQLNPSSQQFAPLQQTSVSFIPLGGAQGQLESLAGNTVNIFGTGPIDLLDFNLDIYNPTRWRYTANDGTAYVINEATGLESVTDTNGNVITISTNGIQHSSGKSVAFVRDGNGRISSITDPTGATILYEYDFYGDLVKVTDREGNETRYLYDQKHNLVEVNDPLGRSGVRNVYDADGRLQEIIDADGNKTTFTYDLVNSLQTVTDPFGNSRTFAYDADGNVTNETDPLGGLTQRTYDANGNVLTETDPNGNTTTFTYDSQGNVLTQTDPQGNVSSFTYDARGNVLSSTDPLGNTTSNTYDASGNPTALTDATGDTTSFTYDTSGNPTSITDPAGAIRAFSYDASGNVLTQTDGLGNVTSYSYDANGNQLTQTFQQTIGGVLTTSTVTNVYDDNGNLLQTTDPLGGVTQYEYDGNNNRTAVIDPLGRRTESVYDVRGLLVATDFPDGTRRETEYDANGRVTAEIDPLGRRTEYTYDGQGRRVSTTFPDGGQTQTTYDAAGRQVASTDQLGNQTTFSYDTAGNQTQVIDALGNVISTSYDAAGRQASQTDPLGNVTQFAYDAAGRLTLTTFADGTTSVSGYTNGRLSSRTDANGNTTQYQYDAAGRLVGVLDALGQQTTYTYDERGNQTSQTDANGRVTSFSYDSLGRRTGTTLPLAQSSISNYDVVGNLTSRTDFNGDTITYAYDAMDRLTTKSFPDGSSVGFTYTGTGQRATVTDALGTRSYTYDALDRLASRTSADGRVISYTYDLAGNRLSVAVPSGTTTYTYDALNRLRDVTDPGSDVTQYTYDAAGNLTQTDFGNGTQETRTYDALNRLTEIETLDGTAAVIHRSNYTLDAKGNRTRVVENSGRQVDYAYDAVDRLLQEDVTDLMNGNQTTDYTYDAVGNRLTKNDSVAGLTTYSYDDNDQLLAENVAGAITNYTYDDNGNQTSRVASATDQVLNTWNFENQLVQSDVTEASGTTTTTYAYDEDGIRIRKTVAGVETRFHVDKNRTYAQVLEEYDSAGALQASYIHGWDLISQIRGAAKSFYHVDGLGSTRALTDIAGAVTDTYLYEAFGRLIASTGATVNAYQFAGEQQDGTTGLYYNRARYMDTGTGRFVSRDSFEGLRNDPITLHKYLYANANPANVTDPTGFFGLTDALISVGVVSALAGIQFGIGQAIYSKGKFFSADAIIATFTYQFGTVGVVAALTTERIWPENERVVIASLLLGISVSGNIPKASKLFAATLQFGTIEKIPGFLLGGGGTVAESVALSPFFTLASGGLNIGTSSAGVNIGASAGVIGFTLVQFQPGISGFLSPGTGSLFSGSLTAGVSIPLPGGLESEFPILAPAIKNTAGALNKINLLRNLIGS